MNKNYLRIVVAVPLAVVVAGIGACNETVGDCYPVGQGPGNGDPGGGTIISTGSGPAGGDVPTGQAQDALSMEQCNASDQGGSGGADMLDTWINCKGLDAIGCMEKCANAGVSCASKLPHPKKPEVGYGDLYMCKNGKPTSTCSYYYSNGDECIFFNPFGMLPWCVYIGGKP